MNISKKNIRAIIYNSGDVFVPPKIKHILDYDFIGSSKKTFYVSGWSIIHFLSGILFGYLYLYFDGDIRLYNYKMFILHSLWELWELWQMLIGMSKPYKLTGSGNIVDTMLDTTFFMLGTYTIRKYYQKYK